MQGHDNNYLVTPDRWSMEEVRTLADGKELNLKPYDALKRWAVFLDGKVLYDGPNEREARKIFERTK